jgi:hypothetical protein
MMALYEFFRLCQMWYEFGGGSQRMGSKARGNFVNVTVGCPAGTSPDFADTLCRMASINIDMGAGNLRLIVRTGLPH